MFVISSLVFVASCVTKEVPTIENHREQEEPLSEWVISSDKYVFIDHHIHTHGELIEGECPILCVDFPTYSFDQANRVLSSWIDFDISEALKVVYGSGSSLSGDAGSGAGTKLSGVYELPYEYNGFEIKNVESDGTSHITYSDVSITLKAGEKWVDTTSRVDTQQYGGKLCKRKLSITDTIVNYGILDKSNIIIE